MSTDPLDVEELLSAAGTSVWDGFPEAGSIGHVHMQVGDTAATDHFYRAVLGFAVTVDYPGASFYGSGGDHHQLAGNIWNSRGPQRPQNMAGLNQVELIAKNSAEIAAIVTRAKAAGLRTIKDNDDRTLLDPWGAAMLTSEEN